MPQLIAPTTRLHDSWLASRDEWGRGTNQDGAGLGADDDVDTPRIVAVGRRPRSGDGRLLCVHVLRRPAAGGSAAPQAAGLRTAHTARGRLGRASADRLDAVPGCNVGGQR